MMPRYSSLDDDKRRISQWRVHKFSHRPEDPDVMAAQLQACAADLGLDNPYDPPSRPVELDSDGNEIERDGGKR